MRLKEMGIKNFRAYQQEVRIPMDENITGITGRNDVGKSTILEALDIFFDGGETSIDKDDFNVAEPDGLVEIRCVFTNLPAEILIDESSKTSLAAEYLLNQNGDLEILKRYKRSGNPSTFIVAEHPSGASFNDLHTLKLADLKKRGDEVGVVTADVVDARKSAEWRAAIWAKTSRASFETRDLDISKFSSESKPIQDKLFRHLPLFALFKSDRESKDNDPLAKTPLQAAVAQAKEELKDDIERIETEIKNRVLDRAARTLEKLMDMDPSLASQLNPRFKKPPTWTFDFTLDGEDDIPINKRGSGVRRLILLNFFRAEAERKVSDKSAPSVIYAFEEPETSQHPSNQEMLIRALMDVGRRPDCQVVVTTHVPALAGLLPVVGLRLVEKTSNGRIVSFGSDDIVDRIATTLGVLPDPRASRARALLLVEGPGDITFVRHAAVQLKAGGFISATLEERDILPVSIGGCGLLKHWVTKRIADQFNIPWGLLLDSDLGTTEHGKNIVEVQTLRSAGKKAYVTRKREPENYILEEVVTPHLRGGATLTISDTCDAKRDIGIATSKGQSEVLDAFWTLMSSEQIRRSEKYTDGGVDRFEFTEMLSDFLELA